MTRTFSDRLTVGRRQSSEADGLPLHTVLYFIYFLLFQYCSITNSIIVRNDEIIFHLYAVKNAWVTFMFSRETTQAQYAKQLLLFVDLINQVYPRFFIFIFSQIETHFNCHICCSLSKIMESIILLHMNMIYCDLCVLLWHCWFRVKEGYRSCSSN